MSAQFVLNQILANEPSTNAAKAYRRVLLEIRRLLIHLLGDPPVAYWIGDARIKLPLSHDLPLFRSAYPQYSTNLARLAAALERKYPNLTIVDIGANVGDTFFLLREVTDCPVLCIDGDERFFRLLKENCSSRAGAVLVKTFVGEQSGCVRGRLTSGGGTGRIAEGETGQSAIEMARLSSILEAHPDFRSCKLIKLDTDGYDCRIIRNELDLLARVKPVLFFEYDPTFFERAGDDGFAVFEALRGIGYEQLLLYDNLGDFMLGPRLGDKSVLEDIHHYFRHRSNQRYLDICAFHAQDNEVAIAFRQHELRFFEELRTG